MNWFKAKLNRKPGGPVLRKPGDDELPKVPQARKYIVEFVDGSVFEVWAHRKINHAGVITFYKITGYRWRDRNWLASPPKWVASENLLVVAEILTTAFKMIRQG